MVDCTFEQVVLNAGFVVGFFNMEMTDDCCFGRRGISLVRFFGGLRCVDGNKADEYLPRFKNPEA